MLLAEEIRNPQRNILIALLGGILIIITLSSLGQRRLLPDHFARRHGEHPEHHRGSGILLAIASRAKLGPYCCIGCGDVFRLQAL